MRKKQKRLVVTFHTTADAMALEAACREAGLAGRLIPVPRALSAGCGLAWRAEPEQEADLQDLIDRAGLETEGLFVCEL